MSSYKPLTGITVVDYTHYLAGPNSARALAALGATVIKVERPVEGEAGRQHGYFKQGESGYYLQQNMGKLSLCINAKDPRGLELMHRLVKKADVLIENYRPGALDRLGLGYEAVSQINPSLIYCSISAFGHSGPESDRPGFGLIAEAVSGAMAQLGRAGEAPPLFRMAIADLYTASNATAAICAALYGRRGDGKGRHIDMALYDCMIALHDHAIQAYTLSGGTEIPRQSGHDLPESTVYGSFTAADGYVVIAAQVDDSWGRLAKLIGGDALAEDARFAKSKDRVVHNNEAISVVQDWVSRQVGVEAVVAALDEIGVPSAPIKTIDQVLSAPQTRARGMLVEQEHPVLGKIELANVPFRFDGKATDTLGVAPALGEHNREIADMLGYDAELIDELMSHGVLYGR